MRVPDRVIAAGDFRVVVEQTHVTRYRLALFFAWTGWPLSLLLTGGFAPKKKYRIAVEAGDGSRLWEEQGGGEQALSDAEEMADQIVRVGVEDFLFKKEHGRRID